MYDLYPQTVSVQLNFTERKPTRECHGCCTKDSSIGVCKIQQACLRHDGLSQVHLGVDLISVSPR